MKSLVVVVSRRLMAVSTSGATSHTYTHISCTTRLFPFFPLAWARWPSRTCRASTYTHTTHTLAHTYILRCPPPSRPVVFIWLGIPQSLLFAAKGPFSSSAGTVVESRSQKQAHVNVHTNVDWRGVKRGRGTKVFLFLPFREGGGGLCGERIPRCLLVGGARKDKSLHSPFPRLPRREQIEQEATRGVGGSQRKESCIDRRQFPEILIHFCVVVGELYIAQAV